MNFFVVQKDLVSQYQQGSCSSFIDGNEIRNWIFGDQTRLWCTGIPGSGKTTAVAALVERLRATYQPGDKVKTAAVFCDFKMTEALSVSNIIAGIWLQITAFSGLGDDTIALYNANLETGTLPSLDDLLRLLQVELRSNLKLLLIIDALDELPDTSAMTLLNAINQLKGNLNVLITSRLAPVHQLPLGLTNAARLEISASSQDLERFIDTRINNQSLLLRHIQKKPELKGEIKDVIKRKCGKM